MGFGSNNRFRWTTKRFAKQPGSSPPPPPPPPVATYTKHRLVVTQSRSGFWTGLKDFWIAATVGGPDTTAGAGVTYFQSVASGGALGTAGNAFDTSGGNPNLATAWEVGFDGPNYPHILGADYTAGTPIDGAQYGFVADGNGGPHTWTFESWNPSLNGGAGAWVVRDTKAGQLLDADQAVSYTL